MTDEKSLMAEKCWLTATSYDADPTIGQAVSPLSSDRSIREHWWGGGEKAYVGQRVRLSMPESFFARRAR